MDFEKAYKEAHSRAEMFRNTIYKGVAEEIFPDLRESSYDEKIRKELIEMVNEDWPGRSDVIAWLEKQDDQKQEWSEEDEERIEQICDDLKCGLENFRSGKNVKGLHFEEIIKSNIDWLKSLRPNHWKPSEERMEAPQKVCIYISGPISGYDLEERRKAFMEIEERLKAQGYETVNPMKNGLPDEATTHEHMKRDIDLLLTCDRIYFMKKWTHSKGCKVEFDVATAIGLPVMFEEAIELTKFCKMITFE